MKGRKIKMEEKNAMLTFGFYPEDYPDVFLSFNCSEDLNFEDLIDFFKRFAAAIGYSSELIDKAFDEE